MPASNALLRLFQNTSIVSSKICLLNIFKKLLQWCLQKWQWFLNFCLTRLLQWLNFLLINVYSRICKTTTKMLGPRSRNCPQSQLLQLWGEYCLHRLLPHGFRSISQHNVVTVPIFALYQLLNDNPITKISPNIKLLCHLGLL